MSYIGVGATEFRILMIAWSLAGAIFGIHEPLANGLSNIDIAIVGMAVVSVFGLAYKLIVDAAAIALEERSALDGELDARIVEVVEDRKLLEA
jgi:hypothetical protein